MKKIVFLFPGQGAQKVGMGHDFYKSFDVAKKTFEEANDLLGYRISDLIFEGPEDKLVRTEYSQLAIFIVSVAIYRSLKSEIPYLEPYACSGLSLGEYSALFCSERLNFANTLDIVQKRANFMNEACEQTQGTMAAVIGLSVEQIQEVVNSLNPPHDLWVANFNCPGQTVISGSFQAVEQATPVLKEFGAKRVLPLQVHGAFHSGYMREAKEKLTPFIKDLSLCDSKVKFVMNVPGDFVESHEDIKKNLANQVTDSVCWEQGIKVLEKDCIDLYVEFGPGRTLSGMNRKMGLIDKTVSIDKVTDLHKFANEMGDINATT